MIAFILVKLIAGLEQKAVALRGEMEVLQKHPEMKVIEKKTANWSRA